MRTIRLRGRAAATFAAIVALLAAAACSTGPSDAGSAPPTPSTRVAPDAFPVTVRHAFGSTTIAQQPTRVATVSWVNADVALALGVVPVAMPKDEYGGNAKGSTPWKDAALENLGAAIGTPKAPAQFSEADGINYTEIAKATPDVILAAYSGLTKDEYAKLSKIAPVVAYPELAYGTSWQDSARLIGQALGRSARAEQLVAQTEATIQAEVARYPQLKGKTFIYGNLEPGKPISIYTNQDNRPRFLTEIGMKVAPSVERQVTGNKQFYVEWSAERSSELVSDVFVSWVADDKVKAAIGTDPLLSQIPAVKRGALVADSDNTVTLSISASSVLSIPWALGKVLPQLAVAADKA